MSDTNESDQDFVERWRLPIEWVRKIVTKQGGEGDASLQEVAELLALDLMTAREALARCAAPVAASDAVLGSRPIPFDRDVAGRFVREAWVRWAKQQPNPKPSWLALYDDLPEDDREADRQIGEALARWTLIHDDARAALAAAPRGDFAAEMMRAAENTAEALRMALTAEFGDDYLWVPQAHEALQAWEPFRTAEPPTDGWQPIETAPRDGTEVDLWLAPLSPEGQSLTPCRCPNASSYKGVWFVRVGNEDTIVRHRATHWRALPAPPSPGATR